MKLRPATLEDLAELLAIDSDCFPSPWVEAGWRAELEAGSLVLLSEESGLGFACAVVLVDACELRRIAVTPSARGRGLGRDLLVAVIAHARALGCDRVELEVAATNLAALALYRAAGFAEVGRRPRYYRDADAVLMTLPLRPPNTLSPT
ncbi:MAG: GNAT family N-acetyltransferase [Enhygromyxa sp.]